MPDTVSAVVEAYGSVFGAVAVEVMAPANVEAVVEVEVKYDPMTLLPRMSPATESFWPGVVVPIPTLPATYAFPVVVAPPEIVRPVVCVPPPIVDDANAVRPPLNCVRVDVAFPVNANGYATVDEITPVVEL